MNEQDIKNKAIDECINAAIEWRDAFKNSCAERHNMVAYNVMSNFIVTLSNLKNKS